jgi:phage tail tape-measure protein
MGKFGMSRAMGMRGVGIGAVGALAGGLMMQSEDEGMQIGGAALSGAGTGAMVGSVIPGIGTAVGAGVGAVIGGFMGYMDRKEEREKAESEKKKEADNQRAEKQEGILTRLAEREVKLMLDGNRLGQGLAVTNYRVN